MVIVNYQIEEILKEEMKEEVEARKESSIGEIRVN